MALMVSALSDPKCHDFIAPEARSSGLYHEDIYNENRIRVCDIDLQERTKCGFPANRQSVKLREIEGNEGNLKTVMERYKCLFVSGNLCR